MRRWIAAGQLVFLCLVLVAGVVHAAQKTAIIDVQGMVCSG